ncbi:MAG TPA: MBL fold metallo-hydrolase [Smithellaceae bacterium]|nr:MBL fold metallo-hydrolase [Smithellaceae bacterium]HRS90258.1 MBL fold metallo-hydrolase [Smithellaceae bacterium]HRV27034.1 MBL fold metallo-hydrolase [Smithellaceae bacterium]
MITQISSNFYRITSRMPYRLRHVHAYLLAQDNNLALFDTGLNTNGALAALDKDLHSVGLDIRNIRQIYLTHVHTDHCSMAGLLQKMTGAKVSLSAQAFEEYRHYRKADEAVTQARSFYARHGMTPLEIDAIIDEFEDIRGIITEFDADEVLEDKQVCKFGSAQFEIVSTPGHAGGHLCFFFPGEKFLLAGDHILPYIAPSLTPDIFDEDYRPLATYLKSLDKIEKLNCAEIHPGHGNSLSSVNERIAEIRAHHEQRKNYFSRFLNNAPKTARALAQKIFGEDLPDFEKFLALNETFVYLQDLKAEGAISENMEGNVFVYAAL